MTLNHDLQHCPLRLAPAPQLRRFRVAVGHWDIEVDATNERSAVDEARRELCRQLPRLWDVIQTLPPARFTVAASTGSNHTATK